jgi:hypothetical protein
MMREIHAQRHHVESGLARRRKTFVASVAPLGLGHKTPHKNTFIGRRTPARGDNAVKREREFDSDGMDARASISY